MQTLHLVTLPRRDACHVPRASSLKPLSLAALRPWNSRIQHGGLSLRTSVGRPGPIEDGGLEDDDFLPSTDFEDQVDLDEGKLI